MNRNIMEGNWKWLKSKTAEALPKGECLMKEEILPRRAVLRGALAVGCSLLLPVAFSGCDSKKGANSSSAYPESSPAPGANPSTTTTLKKVSQASVQYQAQPKGEQKCDGCINFIAESNACKLVEGQVSPDGWCVLWAKIA